MDGWVGEVCICRKVEEKETVRMSNCKLGVGWGGLQ